MTDNRNDKSAAPPLHGLSVCSVCGTTFSPRVSYQVERLADGTVRSYCSLPCKAGGAQKSAQCDVCGTSFTVTFAYQATRTPSGKVAYVCSDACRQRVAAQRAHSTQVAAAQAPAPSAPTSSPASPASPSSPSSPGSPATSATPATARPRADAPRPYRLAVLNQKGGTGKTTTSINLAAGIAEAGGRVLLVDCDPQGNVGVSLGVRAAHTLYHVLMDEVPAADAVVPLGASFDVLTSDDALAAAEIKLAQHPARGAVLKRRLEPIGATNGYTHVILDCGPSLSLLNQNALCYVDEVLVPVACDYLSLVGVKQVLKTVKNIHLHLGHPLRVGAVLPTFYDARAKICRDALEALHKHFGELCLPPIRNNTKIKEAPSHKKTIFEHDPTSTGADDYRAVVKLMLERAHKVVTGALDDAKAPAKAVPAPVFEVEQPVRGRA